MTSRGFQLSEATLLRAEATDNLAWVAGLDECVEGLEGSWGIRVGESLLGGSESLVARVLCRDGTRANLKVGLPGSADLANEAKVFRLADGRGYARLIAHDDSRNAMLLEPLDRPLADLGLPTDTQLEVICATLPGLAPNEAPQCTSREYNQELLSGDATELGQTRCELLSEMTGVDSRAIWQWGFMERVSTGLHLMQIGLQREGLETLAVADRWSAQQISVGIPL